MQQAGEIHTNRLYAGIAKIADPIIGHDNSLPRVCPERNKHENTVVIGSAAEIPKREDRSNLKRIRPKWFNAGRKSKLPKMPTNIITAIANHPQLTSETTSLTANEILDIGIDALREICKQEAQKHHALRGSGKNTAS